MENVMDKRECGVDIYEGKKVVMVDVDGSQIRISKDDAIAAARAILKHFNVGVE